MRQAKAANNPLTNILIFQNKGVSVGIPLFLFSVIPRAQKALHFLVANDLQSHYHDPQNQHLVYAQNLGHNICLFVIAMLFASVM